MFLWPDLYLQPQNQDLSTGLNRRSLILILKSLIMKKTALFFLAFFLIFLGFFLWWTNALKPVSSSAEPKSFVVPHGLGASEIGKKLAQEGFIKSPLAFKIYLQVKGKSASVKAGEYYLSSSQTLPEIIKRLVAGPELFWVTFPEGLRREEIALKAIHELNISPAQDFYLDFLKLSEGKEGFLFPDTYLLPHEITADKLVAILEANFEKKLNSLSNISLNDDDLKKTVTIASLVERETRSEAERPVVAGILLKRLRAGWPLQVDAAVQYAIAGRNCSRFNPACQWWPALTKEDLTINSPFNTYKFKGLPPTPIANPGLSSLKAAFSPEESDYWFYLHDGQGQIHYAKTLAEHQENIQKYLGK